MFQYSHKKLTNTYRRRHIYLARVDLGGLEVGREGPSFQWLIQCQGGRGPGYTPRLSLDSEIFGILDVASKHDSSESLMSRQGSVGSAIMQTLSGPAEIQAQVWCTWTNDSAP